MCVKNIPLLSLHRNIGRMPLSMAVDSVVYPDFGFADFGKGVHLISGPAYDKTELLSRVTLPNGKLGHLMIISNQIWT